MNGHLLFRHKIRPTQRLEAAEAEKSSLAVRNDGGVANGYFCFGPPFGRKTPDFAFGKVTVGDDVLVLLRAASRVEKGFYPFFFRRDGGDGGGIGGLPNGGFDDGDRLQILRGEVAQRLRGDFLHGDENRHVVAPLRQEGAWKIGGKLRGRRACADLAHLRGNPHRFRRPAARRGRHLRRIERRIERRQITIPRRFETVFRRDGKCRTVGLKLVGLRLQGRRQLSVNVDDR